MMSFLLYCRCCLILPSESLLNQKVVHLNFPTLFLSLTNHLLQYFLLTSYFLFPSSCSNVLNMFLMFSCIACICFGRVFL